mmetsp:Transcript_18567/g.57606  ORF Transcript_18567/g.57606 Transcript_18567/m.57606 type:complete len:215 (+) Transcript_18567:424-1068(+)
MPSGDHHHLDGDAAVRPAPATMFHLHHPLASSFSPTPTPFLPVTMNTLTSTRSQVWRSTSSVPPQLPPAAYTTTPSPHWRSYSAACFDPPPLRCMPTCWAPAPRRTLCRRRPPRGIVAPRPPLRPRSRTPAAAPAPRPPRPTRWRVTATNRNNAATKTETRRTKRRIRRSSTRPRPTPCRCSCGSAACSASASTTARPPAPPRRTPTRPPKTAG